MNRVKKIIDINCKTLKKVKQFLGINTETLIRVVIITISSVGIPEIGFASNTDIIPGFNALNTFSSWVTGPIPTTLGVLAIGVSGGMLAFGEMGPAAKKTMQVVAGTGAALQAPALIELVGSGANGLPF